jgi:aerobic carbon-monoxide dehydrogenase medium subunit
VRTRGTIGGSLAHADPAADWLACLTALGAEVVIAEGAEFRLPLSEFVRGAMQTELEPDALIIGVRMPKFPPGARFGFHKICRRVGEFADAIGVVVAEPERPCICVAAGATLARPLVMQIAGGGSMTLDAARILLRTAGHVGDDYDLALQAAALNRAHDEAFAA